MVFVNSLLASTALLGIASLTSAHPPQKRQSSIPTGQVITACTVPGTVAISFDDGPHIYTEHVLDLLKAGGQKATFFLNGNNYGNIYDYASTIKRMIAEGHQVGSHTWDHKNLATLSAADITSEMIQVETALLNILGYFPYYMRPPFLSVNDVALQTLGGLGYHVINVNIDTQDWQNLTPDTIGNSITNYHNGIDGGGSISLSHDPLNNTANALAQAMIDYVNQKGLKSVPVGACLGDSPNNWYRTARANTTLTNSTASASTASSTASSSSASGSAVSGSSASGSASGTATGTASSGTAASSTGSASSSQSTATSSGTPTPDGSCGSTNNYVCPSGSCCSQYGYCGTTSDFCGTGCQSGFGTCGSSSSGASSAGSGSSSSAGSGSSASAGSGSSTPGAGSSTAKAGSTTKAGSTGGAASTGTQTASSSSAKATGPISPNGSCGGTNKYVCPSGDCCSQYGYCGSTSDFCGTGCQSAFGNCGSTSSGTGKAATTSSTAKVTTTSTAKTSSTTKKATTTTTSSKAATTTSTTNCSGANAILCWLQGIF